MKLTALVLSFVFAAGLPSTALAAPAQKVVTVEITGYVKSGTNGAKTLAGPFGADGADLTNLPFVLTLTFPFDPHTLYPCSGGAHFYYSDTEIPGSATLTINGGTFTFNTGFYDAKSISFKAQLWAPVPKCYNYSLTELQVTVTYGVTGSEYAGTSSVSGTVEALTSSDPLTADVDWNSPTPNPNRSINVSASPIGFSIQINAATAGRGLHAVGHLVPQSFMVTSN